MKPTPTRDSNSTEQPRPDQVSDLGFPRDTRRVLEVLPSPLPRSRPSIPIPQRRGWNPKVEWAGGRERAGVAEGSLEEKAPAFAFTP